MAVAEVLVHVRITLLTLWLGVFPFISGWPQKGHSQYHSHPEVVIPLRITGTGKGMKTPGWLSYSLHFGGQRHIIHMKVKRFLVSRHFPVFTYTDQGALQEDQPYVQSDCYYHGYVEGEPESIVALSSCFGGFQGMLQISDIVYEMKPKRFSATHEHLIYRLHYNETELPSMKCGLTEEQIAQQLVFHETNNVPLKQSNYEGWWTYKRAVEFFVAVDHQRFIYQNRNASVVLQEVFIIVNEIDGLYAAIEVDFILCALAIWTERNPIRSENPERLVDLFCEWKSISVNRRITNDVGHLFIRQSFGSKFGAATLFGMCYSNLNCGVDSFMLDEQYFRFAHSVSHEIGHNFGMRHDGADCTCGKSHCLMSEGESFARSFSNCSYAAFQAVLYGSTCLYNAPSLLKDICGNGIPETGEQCDCGTFQMCTNDPCCQTNCTLTPGAVCGFGLCCKDCQFRASGELCREKENECDLPEWCNGEQHECPEDVFMQHGYNCSVTGVCFNKTCHVRNEQCRQVFGMEAKDADEACYRAVNTLGDRFGNCGNDSKKYTACNSSDILCGRIQCENVKDVPDLADHTTVVLSHVGNHDCWGTEFHFGMTGSDIGVVKDGTECGDKSICMHRRCVPVGKQRCSAKGQCNDKGVCNNKQHCHCDSKWAPPYCEEKGNGGSSDSGPPPPRVKEESPTRGNNLTLLFLIPLLLLLLLLGLIIFLSTKRKASEREEKKNEAPPQKAQDAEAPPQETDTKAT
ncbi:disintegrin and metalloproteinase domain-containing protein 20 [Oryctolagus cuniculus]|uniref:disintegrin and metalloproteinase domain-containing protein 20 n=1 Tax=Oryctolagus cuniculus TaxID=9986 RepID=UPI003879424B